MLHEASGAGHSLSLLVESGGYSLVAVRGLLIVTSLTAEPGSRAQWLSSCGTSLVALWRVESSQTRDGIMSPALASGFLATGPPGKSYCSYKVVHSWPLSGTMCIKVLLY